MSHLRCFSLSVLYLPRWISFDAAIAQIGQHRLRLLIARHGFQQDTRLLKLCGRYCQVVWSGRRR
ncbi:hypothetical protein WK57_17680 [Burkholderia ubonensis]|uniref:Uncharacterized protein n=1 Tax=Burkholderia ubonensis TaxID=101571 RepID=A0AA40R8J0_9BURK|nr:hypothetical protein WL16_13795 [Burkholderia ubonensis]KWB96864.1 hypothetical protein WL43_30300 [Burkholderia ubonensis]KWZ58343.1 hypothetical protein WK57_17680 [Burkholderia ubonensis]